MGLPGRSSAWDSRLPLQMVRVRSLVGEEKSHNAAQGSQKKKKTMKEVQNAVWLAFPCDLHFI